jgi:hypothetical protein
MPLIASLALLVLAVLPFRASAGNIPGHMLSRIIAYQIIQQENSSPTRPCDLRAAPDPAIQDPNRAATLTQLRCA